MIRLPSQGNAPYSPLQHRPRPGEMKIIDQAKECVAGSWQPVGSDVDDQVVGPAGTIGGSDGAPGPFGVVHCQRVTVEGDPVLDLFGKPLETYGVQSSGSPRTEAQLGAGGFWNGEETYSHVEDTQSPGLPHVVQGGIVAVEDSRRSRRWPWSDEWSCTGIVAMCSRDSFSVRAKSRLEVTPPCMSITSSLSPTWSSRFVTASMAARFSATKRTRLPLATRP